jgi:sugar transferase (PEP-CTERM system associated)
LSVFRISRHYISRIVIFTIASDLTLLLASVALAQERGESIGDGLFWLKAVALAATTMGLLYLMDLYNFPLPFGIGELILRLGLALALAAALITAMGYAMPRLQFSYLALIATTGTATLGLLALRFITYRLGFHGRLYKRILVLGTGLADVIISYESQYGTLPFKILGFIDDEPTAHDNIPPGYDLVGKTKELISIVDKLHPDILLVALTNMRGTFPVNDILECRFHGISVEEWPTFYEKLTGKIFVNSLRPSWLIFSEGTVKTRLTETIKRTFDVALSLIGLTLASPLMALTALFIKLDSSGPILFRQERVGKDGKVFVLYKFRSMRIDAEQVTGPIWAREDDPRVTRVGRVLRKIRLDETPQMFNVLFGDMSFIGPRPERPVFVDQLKEQIPFYALRFAAKPGITGWAQVKYQYGSTVEDALEKLQYDLYYVKNVSLFLDLLILLNSIQVVLLTRGAR